MNIIGIFSAFGSYKKENTDLVDNSSILITINIIYSFLSGFIFWGVIGYLNSFVSF